MLLLLLLLRLRLRLRLLLLLLLRGASAGPALSASSNCCRPYSEQRGVSPSSTVALPSRPPLQAIDAVLLYLHTVHCADSDCELGDLRGRGRRRPPRGAAKLRRQHAQQVLAAAAPAVDAAAAAP